MIEKARLYDRWEEFNKYMDYKFAMYDNVCEECFRIVFYGRGYTPEYVDELSPSERKQILDYIKKYIDIENQAKKDAIKQK